MSQGKTRGNETGEEKKRQNDRIQAYLFSAFLLGRQANLAHAAGTNHFAEKPFPRCCRDGCARF